VAPATAPIATPESSAVATAAHDLDSLRALWPAVVELVTGENGLLGACIVEARPVAVAGEELTLAFAATAQFKKKKAEDAANRLVVGEALRSLTGVRWGISYELREELAGEAPAQEGDGTEEEWVARFMTEFDAEELVDGDALTSNEKGA
jgi:DNA polymerase-3 subunit gamma/tau